MAWWNLLDLVVDKSGAADAISERIEHKDGVKSGKANRMLQLLLIGWVRLITGVMYGLVKRETFLLPHYLVDESIK